MDFVQHGADMKLQNKNATQPFSNLPNNFNAGKYSLLYYFFSTNVLNI